MKNKISNLVFSVLFMGILILPVIFLNTKENQISGIDNRVLAEWPGITWNLSSKSAIEDFLDDRIGFREEMIEAYIELNDKLFHV
ncbi:MAG: alginate O-acetyltransferase, partial [Lachnospiraceae bacterium]|nr:alginate O-acetyltransferase [Lachnospiraceae bacterium]